MRITWLISSVITFILGVLFIKTLWWIIIGLLIGIPLILLSIIIFLLGLIMPSDKKVINIRQTFHNNNAKNNNNSSYYNSKEPKIKKAKIVKDKKVKKES